MSDLEPDLFDSIRLPPEVDALLRDSNPWWTGRPGRPVPAYRRWIFPALLKRLDARIAPALVVRGARQVGKTTRLEQTIDFLLREREVDPRRILRVQFHDLPVLLKTRRGGGGRCRASDAGRDAVRFRCRPRAKRPSACL